MNIKKIVFLLMLSVIFFSCKGDVLVNIYVQDLLDLKEKSNSILYTTATVTLEGIDNDEQKAFIKSIIGNVTNERIVSRDYSNAYCFDTTVPIVEDITQLDKAPNDYMISLFFSESGTSYMLSYKYNSHVISKINEWMQSTYYQSFKTDDILIIISINNDSREDFTFTARSVYINDVPFPFSVEKTITRREIATIKISEILQEAISNNDALIPFILFQ